MNRRRIFLAGLPLALANAAGAEPLASPASLARAQFFSDDAQFWFESLRIVGADASGALGLVRAANHDRSSAFFRRANPKGPRGGARLSPHRRRLL